MLKLTACICLFLVTITNLCHSVNCEGKIHPLPVSLIGYGEAVPKYRFNEEEKMLSNIRKPTHHDIIVPDGKVTISNNYRKIRSIEQQVSQEVGMSMESFASPEKSYRRRRDVEENASSPI